MGALLSSYFDANEFEGVLIRVYRMSKVKNGLLLIMLAIGFNIIGINVIDRIVSIHFGILAFGSPIWIVTSILMTTTLVAGIFGVYRVIIGLYSLKKPRKLQEDMSSTEGVWPPAPKPPRAV